MTVYFGRGKVDFGCSCVRRHLNEARPFVAVQRDWFHGRVRLRNLRDSLGGLAEEARRDAEIHSSLFG